MFLRNFTLPHNFTVKFIKMRIIADTVMAVCDVDVNVVSRLLQFDEFGDQKFTHIGDHQRQVKIEFGLVESVFSEFEVEMYTLECHGFKPILTKLDY